MRRAWHAHLRLATSCGLMLFVAHGSAAAQAASAKALGSPAVTATTPERLTVDASRAIASYGALVSRTYRDAHRTALEPQRAIEALLAGSSEASLARARSAWLAARPSYGRSEAFRFYGGPIDAGKQDDFGRAPTGLEGRLNAWPLNEAFIDYVRGEPDAGLIAADAQPITRERLLRENARDDEADVTTGYHAIEYLLWGQDLDADGPGRRRASDFVGGGRAERRRTYLKQVTALLVDDLEALVEAWAPGGAN